VPVRTSLHFTPDGVSRPRAVITRNIALLTEGQTQIIDFSQAMCLPWVLLLITPVADKRGRIDE
jgi:hypothetical protein